MPDKFCIIQGKIKLKTWHDSYPTCHHTPILSHNRLAQVGWVGTMYYNAFSLHVVAFLGLCYRCYQTPTLAHVHVFWWIQASWSFYTSLTSGPSYEPITWRPERKIYVTLPCIVIVLDDILDDISHDIFERYKLIMFSSIHSIKSSVCNAFVTYCNEL